MRLVEQVKEGNTIIKSLIKEETEAQSEEEIMAIKEQILKLCESVKHVLSSYITNDSIIKPYYNKDKGRGLNISVYFKPDKYSLDNRETNIYGIIFLDENLKIINANILTSSGLNVLSYNFIKGLNALYTYLDSGNQHYDA